MIILLMHLFAFAVVAYYYVSFTHVCFIDEKWNDYSTLCCLIVDLIVLIRDIFLH